MKPAICQSDAVAKSVGPGRPKDLEKRAAILDAAKRLFPSSGYEGTSMDAIAADAGVSKLTVYSHFRDKESLFLAAISARCEEQMPEALFDIDMQGPLRRQLEVIGRAFFALITSEDAIALNRLLASGSAPAGLTDLFWEAGPKRVQMAFQAFLRREIAAGQLMIDDVPRASSQFFALLKGEAHSRMLCGCAMPWGEAELRKHLEATAEMFLRAYGSDRTRS
ncbi:MAG: TetR/AcrR family transcriptional regulator [Dokdonella sp.]|uniref:TetR/AcrR family transcriptional regulator n=1 Tax=Dokdonella sp. TaxID=2291710 RepID=UPI0025C012A2|nr:TetR/AcrR family transcriptional regulator [Dokdonella sp.]MBZ0223474.1 TetR/AcrR family transcriptional regulator [Dokdonella sp.]